jgi:hypothetical protein
VSFFGFTPVVPMTLGAAVLMVVVSLITPPPSRQTIERYFPSGLKTHEVLAGSSVAAR